MAFCGNCGTENEEGAKFCKSCGSALSQVQKEGTSNIVPDGKKITEGMKGLVSNIKLNKASKKVKIIVGALVAVVVLAIMVANAKPTINLDDYLVFETEGYDGYGNAHVHVDWDAISEKYADKIKYVSAAKNQYGEFLNFLSPVEALRECVSVKVDSDSKLSNGDEVNCTWDVNDNISDFITCKLKYDDKTLSVSGLTELGKFDAFKDLNVSFSGTAPNGVIDINYTGEELDYYDFQVDDSQGLSNGDTVTIKISDDTVKNCAERYGKVPETSEKEYKVEGIKSYVTKLADINEEALSSMKAQAEDAYRAYAAKEFDKEGTSLQSITYLGEYLLTKKGDMGGNRLYLVYKIQARNTASDSKKTYDQINTSYWYINYENVLVNSDGKVEIDITKYDTPHDTFRVDTDISSGWFGTKGWYYYGYESLQKLYDAVVTSKLDAYNHEENVSDQASTETNEQEEKAAETDESEESEENAE